MPQPRAAAKPKPANAEEARATLDAQYVSYREEADAMWEADELGKTGKLTVQLYRKLETLLFKPTPPAYIKTIAPVTGRQYETTGLNSTQVQYDRMNDVLGASHWRIFFHYTQNGQLCKAIAVVGNDLHWARLVDGEVVPYTVLPGIDGANAIQQAEIIAQREGYGGWNSKTLGDTFKSSETNATKRMLSRLGPGSDVYRGELEEDLLTALRGEEAPANSYQQRQPEQQRRPQQVQRQPPPPSGSNETIPAEELVRQGQQAQPTPPPAPPVMTEEQYLENLTGLLGVEATLPVEGGEPVDLRKLRNEVNEAMLGMPEESRPSAEQRWKLLAARKDDPRQMAELITRAKNAAGQA